MINANYYRVRKEVLRGLNEKEKDITDKELIKYKKVIDSFSPQQMSVFQLLVEQGSTRKSIENLDRFASSIERAILGYLSEEMETWEQVLKADEEISKLMINDSIMESKLYEEHKGDFVKMGASLQKTLEIVENRAKEMATKGMNQKQAIQELKDEFPEVSNALISSSFKKMLKEVSTNRSALIVLDEVSAEKEAEAQPTKLKIVNRTVEVEGENGLYRADKTGLKLELPENIIQFASEEELYNFVSEIKEVFRMV